MSDTVQAELREFAETPDRFTLLSADVERFDDGRVCVLQGPTWAAVSGIRVTADEVPALVEEIRARVAPKKWTLWTLEPSSAPTDLEEQLRALGLRDPDDRVPLLRAVACVEEPAAPPAGIDVRRVDTYEDHVTVMELMWGAFETPERRRAAQRAHLRATFEAGGAVTFLAELQGRPAGAGRFVTSERGSFLIAGAVAGWARRRGVYRALVRARWDDAVARGTPALVTHARIDTSYPILKRLGFAVVCEIRRLEDPRSP